MKLSELIAKKNGLPEGFSGSRVKWDDVKEDFQIVKACILQRPARDENGEILTYSQGPNEGKPIPDRQLALMLRTRSGKEILVRTNSRRLTSLYSGDLDRESDGINQYGDAYFIVEAPEGWMRFIPYKQEYKDGKKGDVADLEEVEE